MTANTTGTTGQVSEPDWSKVRMVVLDRDHSPSSRAYIEKPPPQTMTWPLT